MMSVGPAVCADCVLGLVACAPVDEDFHSVPRTWGLRRSKYRGIFLLRWTRYVLSCARS